MKTIIVLAVLLFGLASAEDLARQATVKVAVVDNISKYLLSNPNTTVTPLATNSNARLNQNVYTLGSRMSGDRLVAIDSGSAQYPSKQNLELTVWYPAEGIGAVVTHVYIAITQDNGTSGRGYVVSGGIGQRYIQIIVEAWNTAYIRYSYSIYGF